MDISVRNEATKWLKCCSNDNSSYQIPFIKINSLSFKKQDGDLYIRYQLDGKLPKSDYSLPKYGTDRINGVVFYMSIDDNYFDGNGNKNTGGPEARLKSSFYGSNYSEIDDGKITVNGKLVDGGPGYDYFTEKYPIAELLINSDSTNLVITASSLAISDQYSAGASRFEFENTPLAATKENNHEIKIDLTKNDNTILPTLN